MNVRPHHDPVRGQVGRPITPSLGQKQALFTRRFRHLVLRQTDDRLD